jgi:hypothetical protein
VVAEAARRAKEEDYTEHVALSFAAGADPRAGWRGCVLVRRSQPRVRSRVLRCASKEAVQDPRRSIGWRGVRQGLPLHGADCAAGCAEPSAPQGAVGDGALGSATGGAAADRGGDDSGFYSDNDGKADSGAAQRAVHPGEMRPCAPPLPPRMCGAQHPSSAGPWALD